jgi:four helix bundle protein
VGDLPKKAEELQQRLIHFGARTTRVAKMLPRTVEGRYISQQLIRSGLSGAPNYAEARAAESRADFIHKLRIVLKELNETRSWLEQIVANGLFSRDKMAPIIAENQELCWSSQHPSRRLVAQAVQSDISDFGLEMQDSSAFRFSVPALSLTH